jgi:scyllo-inosamine-4-phosphate amidinotransferase 1
MKLSANEWDPVKVMIVGRADGAQIPAMEKSLRTVNFADLDDVSSVHQGFYPRQVIEESNEDLEIFVDFLSKEGIQVLRPAAESRPSYYNYCPRDTVLVTKNKLIAAPMPIRARTYEYFASQSHFTQFGGITKIPTVKDDSLYNENCIGNPDLLALNETHPAFDAANIIRANDDLYYLVSNTGNRKGAEVLQEILPDHRVHIIEGVYSYIHIDSTIAFLREGLMLLNPSRVKSKSQLPQSLQSWDAIWCPEPVDIGHYPGICMSSPWVNVNLFSVNPNLVVLEKHQEPLRKELEKYGIDCAMLPLRHARTLGGCFHCVTLDLVR